MQIRKANLDDIEQLFDIRTSVTENHQSREEIAALGITPATVADMLQTDCAAWLAEVDGQGAGFAIANATEQTIFGIFIRPEFEGKGIGRSLMAETEQWLWRQGADSIWLLTGNDPNLRAYGFYLYLGWTATGVVDNGDFAGEMKFVKSHP